MRIQHYLSGRVVAATGRHIDPFGRARCEPDDPIRVADLVETELAAYDVGETLQFPHLPNGSTSSIRRTTRSREMDLARRRPRCRRLDQRDRGDL